MKSPHENYLRMPCWQLSPFAHTSQLINLIEAISEGLFYQGSSSQCVFISSCDLFWSHQHCGITAECGVDKSITAQRMFTHFANLCPCAKRQVWHLRTCGTNSYDRQAQDHAEVRLEKTMFTHSNYSWPNFFSVSRFCSEFEGSSV